MWTKSWKKSWKRNKTVKLIKVTPRPNWDLVCCVCGRLRSTQFVQFYADIDGKAYIDYYCAECHPVRVVLERMREPPELWLAHPFITHPYYEPKDSIYERKD